MTRWIATDIKYIFIDIEYQESKKVLEKCRLIFFESTTKWILLLFYNGLWLKKKLLSQAES